MDGPTLIGQLEQIRAFQIEDLRKADALATANFLVCVGCSNETEMLGGIVTGLLGKQGFAEKRFNAGITILAGPYVYYREALWDLRNSMVHAYVGKTKAFPNVRIGAGAEPNAAHYPQAVQFVQADQGPLFVVNVTTWRGDLDRAWNNVIGELRRSPQRLQDVGLLFDSLPFLL